MARTLHKTSTSSKRSSKACKGDGRNVLVGSTMQMNFGYVKFLCTIITFNLKAFNGSMGLRNLCTDCVRSSFHKGNFGWVSTCFLKEYNQVPCRF